MKIEWYTSDFIFLIGFMIIIAGMMSFAFYALGRAHQQEQHKIEMNKKATSGWY
jgi:hypothetical protein